MAPVKKRTIHKKMLKIITKNGILWQKGDNKGVFPVAFYLEMRLVKSLRHFYADEYDAWNAKIGLVPHILTHSRRCRVIGTKIDIFSWYL